MFNPLSFFWSFFFESNIFYTQNTIKRNERNEKVAISSLCVAFSYYDDMGIQKKLEQKCLITKDIRSFSQNLFIVVIMF